MVYFTALNEALVLATGRFKFDDFELDCDRYELFRAGRSLKLERIPMELLILLVAKNGNLVTRQEIVERLWGSGVFVDTEHGINTAIRKVRQVLRDDPEQPRFVQTVTGKGYRFIAIVPHQPTNGSAVTNSADGAGLSVRESAKKLEKPDTAKQRVVWLAVGALVLLLAAIPAFKRFHKLPLAIRDTIVLADFSNSTGDAVFDDTLKTALSVSLRQSPFLNVVSDSRVAQTLQQMTRPVGARLTPEVARELCQRAGSKAYIAGAVAILGSDYVVGLKAVNCQNGDTLAQEQVTAANKEAVLDSLGSAASKLRAELGESLASVQKFDVPLQQATTASLEALKAYSLGWKAVDQKGSAASLPYFLYAIDLDPTFAMAYRAAGSSYSAVADPQRASEYFTKAFQLREHASALERLEITGGYYDDVTGELDKAAQAYEEEREIYPREALAHNRLGLVLCQQGQYEKGIEVTKEALRLAPDRAFVYGNLATYSLAMQRFDEARQFFQQAQSRKIEEGNLVNGRYGLAFLEADSQTMADQLRWFAANRDYESNGLALAADTEAYAGHLSRSRELTKRAIEAAKRNDDQGSAALFQAIAAQREAAYGNAAEARQQTRNALKLAPANSAVESEVALAFAMTGDAKRAEALAQVLDRRFPKHQQIQLLWLPAIQGQVALSRKNSADALNRLKASSIELGNIMFLFNSSCLYHVYVRGEAYLAAGQGGAAAAEFQKILDHGGLVWNCWTGAMAHLGVARANALQSRTLQGADADAARVRARAAYNDFLALWKQADPDIPVLRQAEAECAKLQ